MRSRRIILASSSTLALALLAGCASSPAPASSAASSPARAASGKPISKLSIAVSSSAVDSDDPAYGGSSLVMETTMPLLTYTPRINGKAGTVAPGLATAVPVPTNGGKTYEFHLKPGIKYSNGQPVLASDFKYAVERLYLANDYPTGKFSLVAGAAAFAASHKGGITGIVPDNTARTITFNLTAPMPTFNDVMAQYFTAPVPSTTPSTQDDNIPSTGPMVVTSFTAGQSYTLVKNPYFMPTPALPASNVGTIVATVVSDPNVALTQTLDGTYDYDDENVPTDQLSAVLSKDASQTVSVALAETNMFSLNTSKKPFDDVRVRQAVNYAIDRTAMAKLSGGLQLPTENILPPGETSYKKITAYPYDLARAKSLVQAANATGDKVTILASGDPTSEPYAVYLANQLKAIGLDASINVVPSSTFFNVPSVPSTDPEISWYPWNELIPDASDWIGQLFDGRLINNQHNEDWSMFNDPAINSQISAAEALPLGSARDAAWAALDQELIVKQAAVAPYGNPVQIAVFAPRISTACYSEFIGSQALLSNFCLK
jgi:peptide/nickel transport system substrate-binding protein